MFSYGFLHMDTPVLADQQRLTSALCRHWIQSGGSTSGNGKAVQMA